MTDVRFIVNPISGGKDKSQVVAAIERFLAPGMYRPEILYTRKAGDATRMAREAEAELVVAVGGDGTVSEVARALVGSGKTLGVIPCGSGDGLALHLGISRSPQKAVSTLNAGCRTVMDVARMNDRLYFCTAGLGLDASVSLDFAQSESRGLANYITLAWKEWQRHPEDCYVIQLGNESWSGQAVFVTVANANQWGNGARIAPMASLQDGLLDVVAVLPFSTLEIPDLAARLMTGRAQTSRRYLHFTASRVHITRTRPGAAHCDGDPFEAGTEFDFEVLPAALKVIVPRERLERI